jgi:HK97 family phage major capsid protein
VTEALAGFLQEFNGFQAEVTSALHQQEERLTMLQAKTMTYGRPILSTAVETEDAPHKKAFNAYLRHGDDEALRGLALEGKALSTAVAGDGGYLVDPRTADTVKSMLVATGSIRSIASVSRSTPRTSMC